MGIQAGMRWSRWNSNRTRRGRRGAAARPPERRDVASSRTVADWIGTSIQLAKEELHRLLEALQRPLRGAALPEPAQPDAARLARAALARQRLVVGDRPAEI